jgi:hypothetical protein
VKATTLAAAGLAVTALAGGTVAAPAGAIVATHHHHQRHHPVPGFGLYDAKVPKNAAYTRQMDRALPVTWVLEYESLFSAPPLQALRAIHGEGAMPILVDDPYVAWSFPGIGHPTPAQILSVPVRLIASGQADPYLRWYADQLRNLRFRVGLSFGHEMNGDWYSWGYPSFTETTKGSQFSLPPNSLGLTPPRLFVKAWRHLHDVFTRQKAWNVTWIWTVNRLLWCKGCPSPRAITRADWPGSRYVNWIGIDGYPTKAGIRFRNRLAPTVRFVRTFARKPVLIQETGVWPGSSQWAQFRALVQGVRRYHLLGWVYENRKGGLGPWTLTRAETRFLGRLLRRYGYQ